MVIVIHAAPVHPANTVVGQPEIHAVQQHRIGGCRKSGMWVHDLIQTDRATTRSRFEKIAPPWDCWLSAVLAGAIGDMVSTYEATPFCLGSAPIAAPP